MNLSVKFYEILRNTEQVLDKRKGNSDTRQTKKRKMVRNVNK